MRRHFSFNVLISAVRRFVNRYLRLIPRESWATIITAGLRHSSLSFFLSLFATRCRNLLSRPFRNVCFHDDKYVSSPSGAYERNKRTMIYVKSGSLLFSFSVALACVRRRIKSVFTGNSDFVRFNLTIAIFQVLQFCPEKYLAIVIIGKSRKKGGREDVT